MIIQVIQTMKNNKIRKSKDRIIQFINNCHLINAIILKNYIFGKNFKHIRNKN